MLRPITQLAITLAILVAPQMAAALERVEPENRVSEKNSETQAGVGATRGLNPDRPLKNQETRWGIVSDCPDVPNGIPGSDSGIVPTHVPGLPSGGWDLGASNYLMAAGDTQNAMANELLGAAYGFTGGPLGPMMNLPFIMQGLGASPETMAGIGRGELYGGLGATAVGLPSMVQGLGSLGCFVEGTEVVAEEGLVAIEDVKAGDWVWTHDPESGTTELREVLAVGARTAHSLVHLYIGESTVTTTDEHPFWVDGRGWTKAGELARGDVLWRLNGGTIAIDDIELEPTQTTVYNLEVEGFATYFVSEPEILVHNSRLLGSGVLGRAMQPGTARAVWTAASGGVSRAGSLIRNAGQATWSAAQSGVGRVQTWLRAPRGLRPCFAPGTQVLMADGSVKPIEDIEIGDIVLADDPDDISPPSAREVLDVIEGSTERLFAISVAGVSEVVEATSEHPFWTATRGWTEAQDLVVGDVLLTPDGQQAEIDQVEVIHQSSPTHNLTIDGESTYFVFVGEKPVLVHNIPLLDLIKARSPYAVPDGATLHGPTLKAGGYHQTEWRWYASGHRYSARFHGPTQGAIAAGDTGASWVITRQTVGQGPGSKVVLNAKGGWTPFGQHAAGQTGKFTHLRSVARPLRACP